MKGIYRRNVKLGNNNYEIIQNLKNEVSPLQNCVGKLESQVYLEDALINNEIKINNAGQHSRGNNILIQGISESVKSKDLEREGS